MEIAELKNIIVSSKVLCQILDYDHRYISELVNDHGLPKIAHNKYPLLECIEWDKKYQKQLAEKKIKEARDTRSRLEAAQAELKELELKEKQNELGPVAEFELAMKNEVSLFVKMFNSLGTQLRYDLNLSPEQNDIIQNKIDNFLKHYASLPAETNSESVAF